MSFDETTSIVDIPNRNRGRKVASISAAKKKRPRRQYPDSYFADRRTRSAGQPSPRSRSRTFEDDEAKASVTLRAPSEGSRRSGTSRIHINDDELTVALGTHLPGVLKTPGFNDVVDDDRRIKTFTLFYGYEPDFDADGRLRKRKIPNPR